ncbi:MAG: glycoside hydrolase family 13 protein [Firmicutes bacterium]|nr:glycoside hydrolase family 13 protein [Bacillota bacterium]
MLLPFDSRNINFKSPFGATDTSTMVKINFPVPHIVGAEKVFMLFRGKHEFRLELYEYKRDLDFVYFKTSFCLEDSGAYFYRFELHTQNGMQIAGHNGDGKAMLKHFLSEWQLTVYKTGYQTPDWLKGGVIYQIFPDRFNRVADAKSPARGYLKDWHDDVTIVDGDGVFRANDFFGGNIKGVKEKIPYLKDLGVTAIYFCPIHEATSNHRYDIGNYMKVDELFGTEEELKNLIDCCHSNGIGIIMDGVFNHTGADSLYFNKFKHYDSEGACQSKHSPYYDWYSFQNYPDTYSCWWGITVVPEIRRDAISYQNFIAGDNGVIEKFSRLGVKGWRLDVVDEISPDFVKKIRAKVKSFGDLALIGEVWEDASTKYSYSEEREYFFGEELDGVMNYVFKASILDYIRQVNPKKFVNEVMSIAENYPRESLDLCMNIIGTHDTVRIINELSGKTPPPTKKERLNYRLTDSEYNKGKTLLKLASVLQYMLPGIPTVYYGDEVGLQGYEDPINRRPFPRNTDKELLSHYTRLGAIRKEYREEFKKPFSVTQLGSAVAIKIGNLTAIVNASEAPVDLCGEVSDILTNQKITILQPKQAIVFKTN